MNDTKKNDRINTKHPLDISDMTDEELNSELEKGYASMRAGNTISAEEVFAAIHKENKPKNE